jgi:Na+/H+-dicarboxylate symporter
MKCGNAGKPVMKALKSNALTIATLAGVIGGIVLGACLKGSREEKWTSREVMYIGYVGQLFLNMLKCVIIPLIIPSLIASVGGLDLSLSKMIGLRAIVYYLTTTVMAVILGIILVVTIQPGVGNQQAIQAEETVQRNITTADTLMDLIRNCFPPNIIQANLQQYQTVIVYPGNQYDNKTGRDPDDKNTWKVEKNWTNSTNILGLVVFSIVTGIAISMSGEEGKPLLRFVQSVSVVMMKVTTWIIHLAPVGVLFLIASQILEMENMSEEFGKLGWYFGTVMLGLSIHALITLPLLYIVSTRSLPFRFLANMSNAYVTAFGTASSSATLPVTMNALEEKNGVDARISRFVLPIGATINMDGTALYEAVAAIFIAQMNGIFPSIGQIIAISITATCASIGAAGIPQAGLVTMVMVLDTVGLPSESISIILSLDWLLDRFRTAINVLGDSVGAGIVAHLSKKELEEMTAQELKMREEGYQIEEAEEKL